MSTMEAKKSNMGRRWGSVCLNIIIMLVILATSLLSNVFLSNNNIASAANYSDQLRTVPDVPYNTSGEHGIWLDRAHIVLYWSSEDYVEGRPYVFSAPAEGLNKDVEYINETCNKITGVSRPDYNSTPSAGRLTKCDGSPPVNVTIYNEDFAKIDGYIYDAADTGTESITMPRYLRGIDGMDATNIYGCSNPLYAGPANGGLSGKYDKQDGVFEKTNSNRYELIGDNNTWIDNLRNDSNRVKKAKQHRTSTYDTPIRAQSCTLSYAGNGEEAGRDIYLLKDYSYTDALDGTKNKILDWQSIRGRVTALTDYFNSSDVGRAALQSCKQGLNLGGTSRDDLILRIAEQGENLGDPFVDCLMRELEDDPAFSEALGFEATGDFSEQIIADTSESCDGGGIPIISDLVCSLVRAVFDWVFESFTSIISYLASPPDMFDQQNSTLEQAMSNLRNVANIIFILAFLLVVLQYMTNLNVVDAYFIKKFIPRLVIAVVLVQASFFITSELNGFFYDLGKSVQSLVFFGSQQGDLQITNGVGTLAIFAAPSILGFVLIIGIVMLIVLIITFVILAIRYILIIVLAILAPLAFAALAIPQLESVTKKWFNMYIKLLLMYPIIMFFIAASSIIGGVFSGGNMVFQLFGIIVQFLPFIILPFTFKFAGGIMGGISAKLQKAGTGAAKKYGKQAYDRSDYKMGKDYAKEQDRKRKQTASQARKRDQILAGGGGARGAKIRSDPHLMADLRADQAQHELQPQIAAERLRKVQQSAETQRIAEEQRNIAAHIRGGGYYEDRDGRQHTNERDASLAYLADQAAANARLGTTEGMDNANIAMGQLLANGGDTPFVGQLRDSLGGDSAEWDGLRSANYTPLAAVRADLAAATRPGSTDDFFSVASTVEKMAGQKREAWHTAAQTDATRTMAAYDDVKNSGGGNAGKLADSTHVVASVVQSINNNHAQVGDASLVDLQKTHDALHARHQELINTPGADASVIAATASALRVVQNEVAGR